MPGNGNGNGDWKAAWRDYAMIIGDGVYASVNTEETLGTDKETGYILMFFNVKNHNGRSTLLGHPDIPLSELKQLLRAALNGVDKAKHIKRTEKGTKEV